MKNDFVDQRREEDCLCYAPSERMNRPVFPLWTEDINRDHIGVDESFIENVQDGYCGPFTSYYVRYNNINSYLV